MYIIVVIRMQKEMAKLIDERDVMKLEVKRAHTLAMKANNSVERSKLEYNNTIMDLKKQLAAKGKEVAVNTNSVEYKTLRNQLLMVTKERDERISQQQKLIEANKKLEEEVQALKHHCDV